MTDRRFILEGRLGRGAHGVVFQALMQSGDGFERRVALKLLSVGGEDAALLEARLRDEGRLLGLLAHPCLVDVLDVLWLQPPGGPPRLTVVMALVPGIDLDALLGRIERLPPRAGLELVGALAGALAAAASTTRGDGAALGVIHRDIKPSNIRLSREGAIKLLDFGVARAQLPCREARTEGEVYGTRGYVAPERLAGARDTSAGDVYSLGAVLYECLSGRRLGVPFDPDRSPNAWVRGRLSALEIEVPELPGGVVRLLERMLSQDPQLRPGAAEVEEQCLTLAGGLSRGGLRAVQREHAPSIVLSEGGAAPASGEPAVGEVWTPARHAPVAPAPAAPELVPPAAGGAQVGGASSRIRPAGCVAMLALLAVGVALMWGDRSEPIPTVLRHETPAPVVSIAPTVSSPSPAPAPAPPAPLAQSAPAASPAGAAGDDGPPRGGATNASGRDRVAPSAEEQPVAITMAGGATVPSDDFLGREGIVSLPVPTSTSEGAPTSPPAAAMADDPCSALGVRTCVRFAGEPGVLKLFTEDGGRSVSLDVGEQAVVDPGEYRLEWWEPGASAATRNHATTFAPGQRVVVRCTPDACAKER